MTFRLRNVGEGVALALDAMRTNKLRSSLTVLGVVIGVATVMVMASLVEGIRTQIFTSIESSSPRTFYIVRFFSSTPLNPQNLPAEVRIRPVVSERDAEALRRVDAIRNAGLWVQVQLRMEFGGEHTQSLLLYGADNSYLEVSGSNHMRGRWFSTGELLSGDPVIVLEAEVGQRLFGQVDPLGHVVRVGGRALTVIGVFSKPENVFEPPGADVGGVMPLRTVRQNFQYDETNAMFVAVTAAHGYSLEVAQDAAVAALRRSRGLHPATPNTFDAITQDQILATVDKLTGAFFMVMVALSSVALLVGGIGVMAIMMVSVTDRTREIGIRKAMGATRGEILWQFLVEAATLTLAGGLLGITVGLLAGEGLKALLSIRAGPPIWSTLMATAASVAIGLVFGVIPANRASKMDPVEALRYE